MAWNTITDVNDGETWGGVNTDEHRDAIIQIQDSLAADENTNVPEMSSRIMGPLLTLNDDEAAFLSFSGDETIGIIALSGNVSSAGGALYVFRVGGSSAYVAEMAASTAVYNSLGGGVSIGGTGGPDGAFNLRAHDVLNRLYVNNRLGGTRAWRTSFLAIGTDPASSWTIV